MLVAYVTGHGYGHATRVGEVLRRTREMQPSLPITVVTSGPEPLYRRAIPGEFAFRSLECDLGLVQKGALVIDEAATAAEWKRFNREWPDRVDAEWRWLRHSGATAVLGDIPPLAFQAAHEAGVPSIGLANFSWDWIYRHLGNRQPALRTAAEKCAAAYRHAGLLLKLPFAGDLSAFPRIEEIPLVARRPSVPREDARRRLDMGGAPLVLFSFGGLGLPGFDYSVLGSMTRYRFILTGMIPETPPNVRVMIGTELEDLGLAYEDLVGASDVVITKPGYGIVSDAIGARTRLVYTDRGDFPEYPILVREMPKYLPVEHVTGDELFGGHLERAIEAVLARPMPETPELGGADIAAFRVLETIARR
jgi:L-arabinokinase